MLKIPNIINIFSKLNGILSMDKASHGGAMSSSSDNEDISSDTHEQKRTFKHKNRSHLYEIKGEEEIKRANIFVYEADNPIATIIYLTGWGNKPSENKDVIQHLLEENFNIVGMALVAPEVKDGFMEENIDRIKSFLFDKESFIHNNIDQDLPKIILTHSTSGMAYQHALHEVVEEQSEVQEFKHTYHTSPFFDISNASSLFNPRLNKLYSWHASNNHDKEAGRSIVDQIYYKIKGISQNKSSPTYSQISELISYGQGYFYIKNRNNNFEEIIPQTFYISTDDGAACPKTSEQVAILEGAEIVFCKLGHNILGDANFREKIIFDIKEDLGVLCQLSEEYGQENSL